MLVIYQLLLGCRQTRASPVPMVWKIPPRTSDLWSVCTGAGAYFWYSL